MTKFYKNIFSTAVMLLISGAAFAQSIEFCGVRNTMRYDDGDDAKSEYIGWNSQTGKAEFRTDYGLWALNMNGNKITSELVHDDNLMYGNSGSFYKNGVIYTFFSHEDPDAETDGVYEFVVRKWDAKTYKLISSQRYPKSSNLESRGLAFNPTDGKVYGLFYLTDVALPEVDGYEPDQDDIDMGQTTDAGYALCTIDLETMELTQITPGIYYDNFVTLACSPEGRMFSMTSGGTLIEFDTASGLMIKAFEHSGVESQFKRQSACFDHKTGKMYWNGYVNSGKGINDWGSWSNLPDREWRTNHKFDTALYEVDTETGKATKIADIPNRIAFSALWVVGADGTDVVPAAINAAETETVEGDAQIFNAAGQLVSKSSMTKGLYIIKQGNVTKKIMNK